MVEWRASAMPPDQLIGPTHEGSGGKGRRSSRGGMRPLPVYSDFAVDVPVTAEETQKVLAALGADFAAIFEEDG